MTNLQQTSNPFTVYSLNVDSFKSPASHVAFERMRWDQPDVICLQETGRSAADFPNYAQLEGYRNVDNYDSLIPFATGVTILSKHDVSHRNDVICQHQSCGGRFIEARIGNLSIASVYAHTHDSRNKARWPLRFQFLRCLSDYMRNKADKPSIIAADLNLALTREDVATDKQWRTAWANGWFLGPRTHPDPVRYREPIVNVIEGGTAWVDSYRLVHGCHKRRATVWFNADCFAGKDGVDEGYGIDYQLVTASLKRNILGAELVKPESWSGRFSNHALTIARYAL